MRSTVAAMTLAAAGLALPWLCAPAPTLAAPPPVIERLEPTSGPPGTEVQIVGRHLPRDSQLFLGDHELEVLRKLPGRWTVRISDGAATAHLVIRTPDGAYRGPRFRVTAPPPRPEVTSIEPSSAPPGAVVVLHGENFVPTVAANEVTLGGRRVVVTSATPTALKVVVPAGAESGPFVVRIAHADEVQSPELEVTAPTAITSVEPRRGPPGGEVTLRGTGFSERVRHNRVFLGGRRLRVRSASPTELVVAVPRRGASDAPILVDVRGGGRAQTRQAFEVQEPPRLIRLDPGRAAPGGEVTIHGRNFGSDVRAVRVMVGEHALKVRRVSPEAIRVEVPEGAESGKISVRVHALEADGPALEVLEPLRLEGFEPASGPPGTEVVLRGTGFSSRPSENRVTLSGSKARVVRASPHELRVRVPSAASGVFDLAVEDSGTVRSTRPFVVTRPPVLASFEPRAGAPGTEVTLRGSHFGTNANLIRVELAGRPMDVRSVDDHRIVVAVPKGASTGRISVRVRLQGRATSGREFQVTGKGD